MTKQELESKIAELTKQCQQRVTALQQNDPTLQGLLNKREAYAEWLESLGGDEGETEKPEEVAATNGKATTSRKKKAPKVQPAEA